MSENVKNPLSVMLGAFLQNQRKKMPSEVTVDALSEKLRVSTSLYKMCESGNASFGVNRIFDLIRTFSETRMEFDRLAKFLSAQTFIEQQLNEGKSAREAFEELGNLDDEFKELLIRVGTFFDLPENSKERRELLHSKVSNEVGLFLSNKRYFTPGIKRYKGKLIRAIEELPSLNVEVVMDVTQSLAGINPQHFGYIAKEWEEANSSRFKKVEGFYTDPDNIIKEDNLRNYLYWYLSNPYFLELHFIFVSAQSASTLLIQFKEILTEYRKKAKIPALKESELAKIKFSTISSIAEFKKPGNQERVYKILRDPYYATIQLQAFWVFTTLSDNKIGFVGVNGPDINRVYNLSYKETMQRSEGFKSLWQELNPSEDQ